MNLVLLGRVSLTNDQLERHFRLNPGLTYGDKSLAHYPGESKSKSIYDRSTRMGTELLMEQPLFIRITCAPDAVIGLTLLRV